MYNQSPGRAFSCASALFLVALVVSSCTEMAAARENAPESAGSVARMPNESPALSCLKAASGPASGVSWEEAPKASTSTVSGGLGWIAGHLNYPSDYLPPQLVYAINTAGPAYGAYSTETVLNQGTYAIQGVAPGTYFVYSAVRPLACYTPTGGVVAAAYTDFVRCGLINRCSAHKLLPVTVRSSALTSGIDVFDWYADPPTFFPAPPPQTVPQRPPLDISDAPYDSAYHAAIAIAMARKTELLRDNMSTCPANHACRSIGEEHDGIQAAYFVGAAGSNADLLACGTYVYKDSTGWRGLRWQCRYGLVFPAVGESGTVLISKGDTSCVNVRTKPGSEGTVVGCLKPGIAVRVDDGPVYVPMATMNGMWWHVTAGGWMADDYLRW
jgi:hypothetical protein